MPRFTFKLQAILKHRMMIEQEKLRIVSEAQARVQALEDELKELNHSVEQTNQDVRRNHLTGTIDVTFLMAHRRFLLAMQRKGMETVQKIAQAKQQLHAAAAALAVAARDRKVLEKLREKQFDRWREELARKELAQLDEIGSQLAFENMKDET